MKVLGLKEYVLKEKSEDRFEVSRRYVSDDKGKEIAPHVEKFWFCRGTGELQSVIIGEADGREWAHNFTILHREPLRLEFWIEVEGERRHAEKTAKVAQHFVDEIL